MFGLSSEIEFEPTRHDGLWEEEAACHILVFDALGVRSYPCFSVAIEAAAAKGLDADAIRERLRAELERDLERRLPEALGMDVLEPGTTLWRHGPKDIRWCEDALRRLGYHGLAPHGMIRLNDDPTPRDSDHWRRTIR